MMHTKEDTAPTRLGPDAKEALAPPAVAGQGQPQPQPQMAQAVQTDAPRFDYRQSIRKRLLFVLGGAGVGLVLAVIDLLTGAANVAPGDVLCVISQWVTGCEAPKIAVTV